MKRERDSIDAILDFDRRDVDRTMTTIGDLDLLGEIPGGGGYDALIGSS
jgi:hypothetical protein